MICTPEFSERRRRFWTTQPAACGLVRQCGNLCGLPGLTYNDDDLRGRTIVNDEYVRGLVLNMLMTDGRVPDRPCGRTPNSVGGHWSESFDTGPAPGIGTLMLSAETTTSVNETLNLIIAYGQATLARLVARGVAQSVDVTGEYLGGNEFKLDSEIFGLGNNSARVAVTGERLSNGWVWT